MYLAMSAYICLRLSWSSVPAAAPSMPSSFLSLMPLNGDADALRRVVRARGLQLRLPLLGLEGLDEAGEVVGLDLDLHAGLLPLALQRLDRLLGDQHVDRPEPHRQPAELLDQRLGLLEVVAAVAGHLRLVEEAARAGEAL